MQIALFFNGGYMIQNGGFLIKAFYIYLNLENHDIISIDKMWAFPVK
jgi:hypothetical protein